MTLSKITHLKVCQSRNIWTEVVNHTLQGSRQGQPPDQKDDQHYVRKQCCEVHDLKFQILIDFTPFWGISGNKLQSWEKNTSQMPGGKKTTHFYWLWAVLLWNVAKYPGAKLSNWVKQLLLTSQVDKSKQAVINGEDKSKGLQSGTENRQLIQENRLWMQVRNGQGR